MKLFLLRHGKALGGVENQKDYDRPLARKGQSQSEKIGKYLKEYQLTEALISSAKRTKETFEIISEYLSIKNVYYNNDLYLASSQKINEVVNQYVTSKDLLLIGHNFGISELINFYTGIDITLSTGMLAIIEFDTQSTAHFSRYSGRLLEVVSPKDLLLLT